MSTIDLLHWFPKTTVSFPATKRWHSPPPVGLPWDYPPPPSESVRRDVPSYLRTGVRRLPNLLSNVAPLARYARRLRYENGLELRSSANHKTCSQNVAIREPLGWSQDVAAILHIWPTQISVNAQLFLLNGQVALSLLTFRTNGLLSFCSTICSLTSLSASNSFNRLYLKTVISWHLFI